MALTGRAARGLGPAGDIVRASLSQQAYEHIKEQLLLGRLEPGRSITFREAAEQFGMSVTPVREALLQLAAEQALIAAGRRSIAVPALSRLHCVAVWDVRLLLEPTCAAMAVANLTPALLRRLTSFHEQMATAKQRKNYDGGIQYNRDFHFALYEAANSPLLTWMVGCAWAQAGMYVRHFHRRHVGARAGDEAQGPHVHTTILKALRAADVSGVERGIARDLIEIRDGILNLLDVAEADVESKRRRRDLVR
jgi:GntR family transcriptional regulator, colanic acid and biofilm gene transcriptional regulator